MPDSVLPNSIIPVSTFVCYTQLRYDRFPLAMHSSLVTNRDGLVSCASNGAGVASDRMRACCLPPPSCSSEHVSAYHMAFKRPKVDRGGGGKGGDHLSAIINGTRVALLRELLASLDPPYGRGFVSAAAKREGDFMLRNGRILRRCCLDGGGGLPEGEIFS